MRIRNYRRGDIPTLVHIQQQAAEADGTEKMSEADFEQWFAQSELASLENVFVITDDDDELNEWGQAGTLEGLEGEAVGYTVLSLRKSRRAYHFLCEGAILPSHRDQGASESLLICARNHARIRAMDFEHEARQEDIPIYFEALLPANDSFSTSLAQNFEMVAVNETVLKGIRLYRGAL